MSHSMSDQSRLAYAIRKAATSVCSAALLSVPMGLSVQSAQAAQEIEEMVVTARKRAETLQEVPMAVSAISGVDLENAGLTDIGDLYGRVPGIYFTEAGGAGPTSDFTYLVLRGVGFNGGLEPATGMFIDGMYQPQIGFDMSFLDLERLEILRGPQGTLFGRNTQAGAVNMVSRKPSEETIGKIELEVAEFDSYRLQAGVSGQIAETLFGGINVQYDESDGYVDNITVGGDQNWHEQITARGILRWVPTDSLEVVVIADMSRKDYNEMGFGVPLTCNECYDALQDNQTDDSKDSDGVQLNIEWDISDSLSLASITGYRAVDSDVSFDPDSHATGQSLITFPAVTTSTSTPTTSISVFPGTTFGGTFHRTGLDMDFFSQELRLSGTADDMDWVVGAYYFDQSIDQPRQFDINADVPFLPLAIREAFTEDRDGYALFGQLSIRPIDRLELTFGGRYSSEDVEVGGERVLFLGFDPVDLGGNGDGFVDPGESTIFAFPKSGESDFSNFTGMFSVSWEFNGDVLGYFTIAEGWKAGGINRFPSRDNAILPYDSEESTNYELGVKATLFDGSVTANLALYQVDIKKQQLLVVIPDPLGATPITAIFNAGQSNVKGIELELDAALTDEFNVSLAVATVDSEFDEFLQTSASDSVDRAGQEFESTPDMTASVTLDYRTPVSDHSELNLMLNYRYIRGYSMLDANFNAPLAAQNHVPSHDRLDFRASLEMDNGWKLTGYVDNVLDSYDYTTIYRDQFADYPANPSAPNDLYVKPLEPRQFGLIVTKTF